MQIERTIKKALKLEITNRNGKPIIVILGARQVGKTTLVKQIIKEYKGNSVYYNCDYLDVQNTFSYENAGNLSTVVDGLDLIVLDEAQRIKNIGLVLKILADEFPKLKIIATGSSSFDLSNQINEPLTGRKKVYRLFPFSFKETNNGKNNIEQKRNLQFILRFGQYPSVVLNNETIATENLKEITSSYLFKDIFTFQNLKKPEILINLLKLLAFQIGNEVSYTEIANRLGIQQKTVQKYIYLLEENFIIFKLPSLKRNLRREVGKSRKIYFWDIGVRNMIIQNLNSLDFRNDIGALWENFCVSERLKFLYYNHNNMIFNTYFWRNYDDKEIDYIEELEGKLNLFEFKWSSNKTVKIPKDFKESYKINELKIINKENFNNFLF